MKLFVGTSFRWGVQHHQIGGVEHHTLLLIGGVEHHVVLLGGVEHHLKFLFLGTVFCVVFRPTCTDGVETHVATRTQINIYVGVSNTTLS